MKRILAVLIWLSLAANTVAQDEFLPTDEIIQSVEEWVRDNLDERALDELGVDKDRVQRFLVDLRRRFQGSYVFDLNALHETATELLPVLQQFEETRPYAVWLQTHLDYFDVAEELRREVKPAPEKPQPSRLPNPSQELQRSV